MCSFDQLHTPLPGNQTPTQGTETPTPYIAAPEYLDRYGLHGALSQAGQFASANNQTYEDAPHDAPEEFLQGSSRQSHNLNGLYSPYNPNWSVDQMIAWLSGVEDVDTVLLPSLTQNQRRRGTACCMSRAKRRTTPV
ncbi:hypothetical protein OBBRIDRAFT_408306 [Obba rivulosa]|uniref:Uncharacterized protein n=1 Tax=Obba rivulosa TaxID=1052685 RepID=A0A8E2DJ61_9APHY|nr:hypothetical protein OBBRIDRAFT_408306 [Obba rivulosa]